MSRISHRMLFDLFTVNVICHFHLPLPTEQERMNYGAVWTPPWVSIFSLVGSTEGSHWTDHYAELHLINPSPFEGQFVSLNRNSADTPTEKVALQTEIKLKTCVMTFLIKSLNSC